MATCPDCAEKVHADAKVCKHCGHRFSAAEIDDRYRQQRNKGFVIVGAAAAAIALVAFSNGRDQVPDQPRYSQTANIENAPEDIEETRRVVEKGFRTKELEERFAGTTPASRKDIEEGFALLINMNGELCARVTSFRRLDSGNFEVSCVKYRGGEAETAYIVDRDRGTASPV